MKVVYTDQSYQSLDDLERFLTEDLDWSVERVVDHRTRLLNKADSLISTYDHYQAEDYLIHLGKRHRRIIEGFCKIIYRV